MNYRIRPFIYLSVGMILSGIFLPPTSWMLLLGFTIAINAILSLSVLFLYGRVSSELVFLNFLQLILFGCIHYLIFHYIDPSLYYTEIEPRWYDWAGLVSVHAFKAVDIFDIIEACGWPVLTLWTDSPLSGGLLVAMNILIDTFLFGYIIDAMNQRQEHGLWHTLFSSPSEFLIHLLKKIRIGALIGSLIVFFFIFMHYFMSDAFSADITNIVTWPLEQFLRIIDIGDAFQIFDWQIHTMPLSVPLVATGLIFRVSAGVFTLEWANHLYMTLFRGRGKTIYDLAELLASPQIPFTERLIAASALERFGEAALPVAPMVAEVFAETNRAICGAARRIFIAMKSPSIPELACRLPHEDPAVTQKIQETLDAIHPHWHQLPYALQATEGLIEQLIEPNIHKRQIALATLNKIDPNWFEKEAAGQAVPYFSNMLQNEDFAVRTAAAEALTELGNCAQMAIYRLIKSCIDPNGHVRHAAWKALDQIDKEWRCSESTRNAIPFLIENLTHTNRDISEASLEMLKRIGEPTFPFIKAMISAKKEISGELMEWVGQIAPKLNAQQP